VFWISLQAVIPGVTEHEDYSLLGWDVMLFDK
jgi:hypothetical protein